ncbi:DUF4870 domain-containing protein [Pseudomonas berkeleyensis]|uniref:DUF4870 domain-containing protein n=1 Tax=Pseudomonas berkeleyensis TaxID=2726956 RepID=A0A7G5DN61_9PSED|nr:DUF4870 domain-containing protein [Pseudomonas berkeleyensis]QMV63186.1 DUF4870 domain-containing protein [Pseudomonas berkeleyensis]WSO38642.1 DUF4870 domain-containing protein [Pseudomonas berkeleyensis]
MIDQQLTPLPEPAARRWAMFCHYSAFFWFLAPMIGNVLGPLIVWQLKKDLDPFVDEQGKEALNFQITVSLALMVCGLLAWVLIGFPLMLLVCAVALVLTIIAGIKANEGQNYRYPFSWRLVK